MNKKIFIIEDDMNTCSALTAKFSLLGFKVVSFVDEQILVINNKIKSFQPDYIVLDLVLPRVNGFDLLSAIKADDQLAKIPVFIFADLSSKNDKERATNLGADHLFSKEKFTLDEFIEHTEKIISNRDKIKKLNKL